jgi:hypothetical protein
VVVEPRSEGKDTNSDPLWIQVHSNPVDLTMPIYTLSLVLIAIAFIVETIEVSGPDPSCWHTLPVSGRPVCLVHYRHGYAEAAILEFD